MDARSYLGLFGGLPGPALGTDVVEDVRWDIGRGGKSFSGTGGGCADIAAVGGNCVCGCLCAALDFCSISPIVTFRRATGMRLTRISMRVRRP